MGRRTTLGPPARLSALFRYLANSVIKWQEGKGTSVFLKPSGYTAKTRFTAQSRDLMDWRLTPQVVSYWRTG
jgi:hypothetical protein